MGLLVLVAATASAAVLVTSWRLSGDSGPAPGSTATPPPADDAAEAGPASSPGSAAPDPALAQDRDWEATIRTNHGTLRLALTGKAAPAAVANFVTLAQDGYFDDTTCHRLTTTGIFVLQCGDPTGTGRGGPGYSFGPVENAPADNVYPAGTLAMARVGNDGYSNGSQFFIVYADSSIPADAAGGYTVFGRVDHGLDVVRGIAKGGLAPDQTAPARATVMEEVSVR
ncbi:MAG: peptidylprolyl isomerase [Micrococcales bacterium]|nr:MAG: peptidylprolyl isomerase [Micrococcales bacterium]